MSESNKSLTMADMDEMIFRVIEGLKDLKPNDHDDLDRRFAICITDAEKLSSYFAYYILQYIHPRSSES